MLRRIIEGVVVALILAVIGYLTNLDDVIHIKIPSVVVDRETSAPRSGSVKTKNNDWGADSFYDNWLPSPRHKVNVRRDKPSCPDGKAYRCTNNGQEGLCCDR